MFVRSCAKMTEVCTKHARLEVETKKSLEEKEGGEDDIKR